MNSENLLYISPSECFSFDPVCRCLLYLTPSEQFQYVFKMRNRNFYFLISAYSKNSKVLINFFKNEIEIINHYLKYAMEKFTKEEQTIIIQKGKHFKKLLGEMSITVNAELPDYLRQELFRHERIYKILITQEQIGDNFTPNLGEVLQNNDLNRYLLEFID